MAASWPLLAWWFSGSDASQMDGQSLVRGANPVALILLATLLTLRPLISRRPPAREPSELAAVAEAPTLSIAFQIIAGALLFLVAIYGGYFGAGIGILMIGAFGLIGLKDIHAILPLKNALAGCLRAMAVGVFLFEGEWPGNMAYLWQLARFSAGISVEKSADI
jgi:uncharacterized membrane protein YfcA